MRFRKVLCGVTAALTVLSSTAIAAQAEEAAELKLLTADFSEISDTQSFSFFGNGYLKDGNKFLKIGGEQISEWSNTGKISVGAVESDLDISGMGWWTGDFEGGYVQLTRKDTDGNVVERYIVHLNEESGKIETAYKLGADWCYTLPNGYTVLNPISDVAGGTVSFTVMKPDGTSFTNTFKSIVKHTDSGNWDDYVWNTFTAVDDEKYCLYVVVDEKTETNADEREYAVYAVDKQGNTEKIAEEIKANACGSVDTSNGENVAVSFVNYALVNNELDAFVLVMSAKGGNVRRFNYYGSIYYVGNNRVVGCKMASNVYDLVDLNTGNVIASYPYIQAVDDNLFLVVTNDNKQGFIDGSNKVLGLFDVADTFYGDYAPVVKDGKAYLIDRNMNCVSDKIDGDNVYSFLGGLYRVDKGDSNLLVTYANANSTSKPDDTSSTTSEPASEPASEPTSAPVSSEPSSEPTSESSASKPDGSDNPTTGAAALIPVALIGGAALVVSRKRRK